jgi:hypothetical protein
MNPFSEVPRKSIAIPALSAYSGPTDPPIPAH